ncbi:LPD7 domain-containing protein [Legionella sp. CNM-4043-24]|uniref:LPD7 domain-containing protein n=1 Tax=Legionella sp. CNM-4043-24 TaxID=3421646 RepID=UPI00403AD0B8
MDCTVCLELSFSTFAIASLSENLADDMEHHAGIESLLGWIKRHCQTELGEAQSWSAFHAVLNCHGLTIRERGNGLIITDPKGLSVKASSVSRQFSKNKLEEKFRMFTAGNSSSKPETQYSKKPIHANTSALYSRFCAEKTTNKTRLSETLSTVTTRKNRLIEQAKQHARLKRTAIKLIKGRLNKKVLYALTHKSLQTKLQLIRQQYTHERQRAFEQYQSRTWLDWLQYEAKQGNKDALAALRTRRVKPDTNSYTLSGEGNPSRNNSPNQNIPTKQGTNIHRTNECTIRDDGTSLILSIGFSIQGLKTALHMAQRKFGNTIKVTGSEAFKQAIVQIAASFKIPIQFEDKNLEQQRQQLSNNLTQQEYQNEKTRKISSPTTGRSTQTTGTGNRFGRRNAGRNPATTRQQKPNPGSIGSSPPPESKNRLRNLSELRVVQLSRGRKVLLPGYVNGKLERKGAKFDYKL